MSDDRFSALTDEDIPGRDTLTAEELTQFAEEWNSLRDDLAGRGPLTLRFPEDRSYGQVSVETLRPAGGALHEARGVLEIDAMTKLVWVELNLPDARTLRELPARHIETLEVLGIEPPAAEALAANPARGLSVKAVATAQDVEDHRIDSLPTPEEAEEYGVDLAELQRRYQPVLTGGAPLTDDFFRGLAGRDELQTLVLRDTEITDDAFARVVPALTGLTYLSIDGDFLGFERLDVLESLTGLEALALSGRRLTGTALARLPVLRDVVAIAFEGPDVLQGLDAGRLAETFPQVEEVEFDTGCPLGLADLLQIRVAFPEASVNGARVSARALAKAAAKAGIEMPPPDGGRSEPDGGPGPGEAKVRA